MAPLWIERRWVHRSQSSDSYRVLSKDANPRRWAARMARQKAGGMLAGDECHG
jgi:hypothetical protein